MTSLKSAPSSVKMDVLSVWRAIFSFPGHVRKLTRTVQLTKSLQIHGNSRKNSAELLTVP
jgi:hypothetical protein